MGRRPLNPGETVWGSGPREVCRNWEKVALFFRKREMGKH